MCLTGVMIAPETLLVRLLVVKLTRKEARGLCRRPEAAAGAEVTVTDDGPASVTNQSLVDSPKGERCPY